MAMTNICRAVRDLSLILLVFATAACTSGISQDTAFDSGGLSNANGNALVVVGLRVLSEPTQHGLFNLLQRELHPVYDVHIRQVTEDGKFGRLQREVRICESSRGILNGAFSDCMPSETQYKVFSVPAGRYTVDSIGYQMDRTRVVTTFNDQPSKSWLGGNGSAVRDPGMTFVVDPGSITYVGDLAFYFDPSSAGAKIALGRHDDAARDALARYPNVHGPIVYRAATGSARLAPVPGALMPIEGPL